MQAFLKKHYNTISKLFLSYGIKSVTMDDIANGTCASKKTIYMEYKCKDELVKEFLISEHNLFKQQVQFQREVNSNAITQTVQLYYLIHRKIILINPLIIYDLKKYYPDLFNETITLYRETILVAFFSVLARGQKEDLFLGEINEGAIANLIEIIIESYVYRLLFVNTNEWKLNPAYFLDFYFRGICTTAGLVKWEIQKQQFAN